MHPAQSKHARARSRMVESVDGNRLMHQAEQILRPDGCRHRRACLMLSSQMLSVWCPSRHLRKSPGLPPRSLSRAPMLFGAIEQPAWPPDRLPRPPSPAGPQRRAAALHPCTGDPIGLILACSPWQSPLRQQRHGTLGAAPFITEVFPRYAFHPLDTAGCLLQPSPMADLSPADRQPARRGWQNRC